MSFCLFIVGIAASAEPQANSAAQGSAPPSEHERQRMVEAMRDYADTYIAKLPNFVCQQVTMQFEAGRNGKHWHKNDTLTSKLVYASGREERTLQLVNNKQVRYRGARPRVPFSSEGEFGILLNKIFDPASEAKFSWAGWEDVGGTRAAKFDFAIDLAHSTLTLINYIKATVPYHGSVYADSQSGAVLKIISETTETPPELQMTSVSTTVEYDHVRIGDQSYLLPISADVLLITNKDQVRNELHFEGYRKFEAESKISFGEESGEPAGPSDKPPKTH